MIISFSISTQKTQSVLYIIHENAKVLYRLQLKTKLIEFDEDLTWTRYCGIDCNSPGLSNLPIRAPLNKRPAQLHLAIPVKFKEGSWNTFGVERRDRGGGVSDKNLEKWIKYIYQNCMFCLNFTKNCCLNLISFFFSVVQVTFVRHLQISHSFHLQASGHLNNKWFTFASRRRSKFGTM